MLIALKYFKSYKIFLNFFGFFQLELLINENCGFARVLCSWKLSTISKYLQSFCTSSIGLWTLWLIPVRRNGSRGGNSQVHPGGPSRSTELGGAEGAGARAWHRSSPDTEASGLELHPFATAFPCSDSFWVHLGIKGRIFWTKTPFPVLCSAPNASSFRPLLQQITEHSPDLFFWGRDFLALFSAFLFTTGDSQRCFPTTAVTTENDGSVLFTTPFPAPFQTLLSAGNTHLYCNFPYILADLGNFGSNKFKWIELRKKTAFWNREQGFFWWFSLFVSFSRYIIYEHSPGTAFI